MVESFLGFTVTRSIPSEVVTGLTTGQYKLHGGVIRWAASTEYAGQIVCHLLPFSQIESLVQINALAATTQQVLQIATGTMVMAGLNLAVTALGFTVFNEKLKNLEGKLNELQKEVKVIRALLELEERARLAAALRDLLNVVNVKNPDLRHTMLFNSKNVLAPISLKYKELLARADTIELAMAYEEYFCLTSLTHTRCLAELGMLEMARRDLEEANIFWRGQARCIANDLLLGKYPERFLFSDFSQNVPIAMLVEWLDIASGKENGYTRIDEFRRRTKSWYSEVDYTVVSKGAAKVTSSLWSVVMSYTGNVKTKEKDREKETVIPSFQKLVSRNNVLEGYVTQYELLEAHNLTPAEFESKVALLAPTATVDGYVILMPAEREMVK